jgi:ABC-type branched-subunit amino acid transport system ATPase component
VRTKLLAFALSGFMAGYAGVLLAFGAERFSTDTFDPTFSILVVSMVVIGGLDSITGAILGAIYLIGLPAIFGASQVVVTLTSGLGLLAFVLYLPGGMAELLHRFGDLVSLGVGRPQDRWPCRSDRGGTGHSERLDMSSHDVNRDTTNLPSGQALDDAKGAVTDADRRIEGDAEEKRGPAKLTIQDLVVAFGGVRAVDGVTLTVEPGSLVGLVGPNGSGKTTLLDAVSGLVRCAEGSVTLDEEDIVDHLPEERSQLGLVRSFQDCRLYPELTVEDTLLVCEDARHRTSVISTTLQLPWARKAEKTKRNAVNHVISSFGLERFRNHRTSQLSTGTRRVVDLASIVLSAPRLLLLDEPTAGIAQREAEAFIPLLKRLQEVTKATVLLVEHDVPLVFELCSKVVVMETGQIVSMGTPDEVSRDPRALAAYLGASEEALNVSGPVHTANATATATPAATQTLNPS